MGNSLSLPGSAATGRAIPFSPLALLAISPGGTVRAKSEQRKVSEILENGLSITDPAR